MKAAIVHGKGQTPVYGDFDEPKASGADVDISVTAAALSQLVRGRASGSHYSSSSQFPFIAGIDGVGHLDDGRRVYFVMPKPPFGSMAERVAVPRSHIVDLPNDLDDVTAAAIANPGMSSWVALMERAKLVAGETVLINGATGTSGRLAVQIARHLGAKKVIAIGRSLSGLEKAKSLGADVTIALADDDLNGTLEAVFADGVDVVLDYLWGSSAERILIAGAKAGPAAVPIRFVQIGAMSGGEITLPSAVLRSSAIVLMGSGLGSISFAHMVRSIEGVMQAAVPGKFEIAINAVPLADVARAWSDSGSARTVFTVG